MNIVSNVDSAVNTLSAEMAKNIKFFAKTLDKQYLEVAQKRIENADFVTSQLIEEHSIFLKDHGFTDKEVEKISEEFN